MKQNKILGLIIGLCTLSLFTTNAQQTHYKTIDIDGVEIFYREAGDKTKPAILLFHGYPSSSHMFRNLITELSDSYYLIAPDYPGFGQSEQPSDLDYEYTFDNLAKTMMKLVEKLQIEKYSIYLQDYGAPVGYRIAANSPERVQCLIIQNGNAYEEGLASDFWTPVKAYWKNPSEENRKPLEEVHSMKGLKWQYLHGVKDKSKVSPDAWMMDWTHFIKDGNKEIQVSLFYDYQNNVKLYPEWQAYLKKHQPPTVIVWGNNDEIFPGNTAAEAYKKDLKNLDFNLFDTGHFALETHYKEIGEKITEFLDKKIK